MTLIPLTAALKDEYRKLFNTCNVSSSKAAVVETIIKKIIQNKNRYETVGNILGIPWYFIAVIHNMESSLNFGRHLHNGDPLTRRTVHVPAGRPPEGDPPFTWEESASDSLAFQKLDKWNDWSLPGLLYKIEGYNGWGYRKFHPHVLSPYLWSFSNHYTSGKYITDGRWSDSAISSQCGAVVLLRRMSELDEISIPDMPAASENDEPVIKYSSKKVQYADELQTFLNKIPGIYVKVDGYPGTRTSDAFKKATGYYLKEDPRA